MTNRDAVRTNFVGFYATYDEREKIMQKAKAKGMSVSAFLRMLALYNKEED